MSVLFDLVFDDKKYINENERESPFKIKFEKAESELLKNLNEEQIELFRSFKNFYLCHLQMIYGEDCDYFLNYGIKIGRETANFDYETFDY